MPAGARRPRRRGAVRRPDRGRARRGRAPVWPRPAGTPARCGGPHRAGAAASRRRGRTPTWTKPCSAARANSDGTLDGAVRGDDGHADGPPRHPAPGTARGHDRAAARLHRHPLARRRRPGRRPGGHRGAGCSSERDLRDLLDLQVVGLVRDPSWNGRNGAAGTAARRPRPRRRDVVGGAPWRGEAPDRSVYELTAAAADAGLPIDLHLDETTDAGTLTVTSYLRRVEQLGLGGRATASHCVSLGQQQPDQAREVARALAGAGVALVVLPQTNLGLQGRGLATRVPRALAPIGVLEEAGVLVAAGGDNWRDPFNPVGRIDPMETASLLVSAGHLAPRRAYRAGQHGGAGGARAATGGAAAGRRGRPARDRGGRPCRGGGERHPAAEWCGTEAGWWRTPACVL